MKNTVLTFQQAKREHRKQTMLTAYDYSTARLIDEAGVNSILVGDSLGMVMLGYEDTLSVTMEDMIHHTRAVTRGAKNALVVADMPFMSYQTSVYDAVVNAGRLMKEGRAGAVKLEGGATVVEQIRAITGLRTHRYDAAVGQCLRRIQGTGQGRIAGTEDSGRRTRHSGRGRVCRCAGVCAASAGKAHYRGAGHSDHRYWRRTGL